MSMPVVRAQAQNPTLPQPTQNNLARTRHRGFGNSHAPVAGRQHQLRLLCRSASAASACLSTSWFPSSSASRTGGAYVEAAGHSKHSLYSRTVASVGQAGRRWHMQLSMQVWMAQVGEAGVVHPALVAAMVEQVNWELHRARLPRGSSPHSGMCTQAEECSRWRR